MQPLNYAAAQHATHKDEDIACVMQENTSAVFGVFDGHGGRRAAELCVESLCPALLSHGRSGFPNDAVVDEFWRADKTLGVNGVHDGTTATCLLVDGSKKVRLSCTLLWCGDTRAVAVDMLHAPPHQSAVVATTSAHTPEDPDETRRLNLEWAVRDEVQAKRDHWAAGTSANNGAAVAPAAPAPSQPTRRPGTAFVSSLDAIPSGDDLDAVTEFAPPPEQPAPPSIAGRPAGLAIERPVDGEADGPADEPSAWTPASVGSSVGKSPWTMSPWPKSTSHSARGWRRSPRFGPRQTSSDTAHSSCSNAGGARAATPGSPISEASLGMPSPSSAALRPSLSELRAAVTTLGLDVDENELRMLRRALEREAAIRRVEALSSIVRGQSRLGSRFGHGVGPTTVMAFRR